MTAESLFESVRAWLRTLNPSERWLRTVQLRYAYFLTHDQVQSLAIEFREDLKLDESRKVYRDAFEWFQQFNPSLVDFDQLVGSFAPIRWPYRTLLEGLGEWTGSLFDNVDSLFVTKEVPDYSTANRFIGSDTYYYLDWMEERGFVELEGTGLMLSRTIQPVVISEGSRGTTSEPIMLLMPSMGNDELAERAVILPSAGGGVALRGVFEPLPLNVNAADDLLIENVGVVFVYRGKTFQGVDGHVSFEPVAGQDAYEATRLAVKFNDTTRDVPLIGN